MDETENLDMNVGINSVDMGLETSAGFDALR